MSALLVKLPADGEPHDVDITFPNEGNWPLELTAFELTGGWPTDQGAVVLQPDESRVVALHFDGSSVNLLGGLVVESNDLRGALRPTSGAARGGASAVECCTSSPIAPCVFRPR